MGCGLRAGTRLHRRASTLDRIARWLTYTADHIRYTAAPLGDVLQETRGVMEFEMLPFLCGNTREAVCEAIRKHRAVMALTDEDERLLCECIDGWGTSDLEGEVSRLRRYGTIFAERHVAAKMDAVRRGRLFVTLGICGGGAAALLLGG